VKVQFVCELPPEVVAASPTGTVFVNAGTDSNYEAIRFEDGKLVFDTLAPGLSAVLYLDGFTIVELDLSGGRCVAGPVQARASVSGLVLPAEGEALIQVQGCGINERVDVDGGFFAWVDPGPCSLFAVRSDGALNVRSAVVEIAPGAGDEVNVRLRLPSWRAAIGAMVRQDGDHFVLDEEIGGLRVGDTLLAVDGEPVGASLWEVLDQALGPAESMVRYTVERDGVELDVELDRSERAR
jgi:hypothetical protein